MLLGLMYDFGLTVSKVLANQMAEGSSPTWDNVYFRIKGAV